MREFDFFIKNAKVIDGTGNPGYKANVGICEDKISYIGKDTKCKGEKEINAEGLVLTPGFIDMHGHSDVGVFNDSSVFNMVEQGITTEISGMCGLTLAPISKNSFNQLKKYIGLMEDDSELEEVWKKMDTFDAFLSSVEKLSLGPNMGFYVGQGTIRIAVIGFDDRKATEGELSEMKELVREAMNSGALGMSTGLIYPPGVYTPTDEIIELCKVVSDYGGSYTSHIRNESHDVVGAVKEAIEIGRKADVPVVISHHKIAGKPYWGLSKETLRLIEEANDEGVEVALDQYPYKAGATGLKATIPPKYHVGGTDEMLKRLKDPDLREQIKADIKKEDKSWENLARNCGLDGIMVFSLAVPEVNGKTVQEYADENNIDPFDALLDLIVKSEGDAGAAYFMMEDEDIERIMKHPYTMIGTDGGVIDPRYGSHPRAMGTFPKVLGRYVREKKVLRLEDAIRKMTSLPAIKAGLKTKGLVKEGFDADLVIFNPETIIDKATYKEPTLKNEGINYVFVNGEIAVKNNKYIGAGSGRVIRLNSK